MNALNAKIDAIVAWCKGKSALKIISGMKLPENLDREKLVELMRDERYSNPVHPQHKAFREMVTKGFKKIYGNSGGDMIPQELNTDYSLIGHDAGIDIIFKDGKTRPVELSREMLESLLYGMLHEKGTK